MSYTPNFGLRYLDPTTHKYVEATADQRNWTFLDYQLFGYASMIGVGCLTGWNVYEVSGLMVGITSGSGFLGGYLGESITAYYLTLPANSTSYIYASSSDDIATTGTVTFYSDVIPSGNINDLLLATVITDADGIVSIDNTVRNSAGWGSGLQAYLDAHHHDGDPITKIDLASEVQGLLNSDNLGPIDASKIDGTLLPENIPQISHTDLTSIGRYTHAQLDTLVDALADDRYIEFGNVLSAVVLQDMMAKSHIYYHPTDPGGYFRFISNLVLVVPGITAIQGSADTPNYADLLDYALTTATIDETNRVFLSDLATALAVPVKMSKTWNANSWDEIISQENIEVTDVVTLEVLSTTITYDASGTLIIKYDTGRVSDFGDIDWVLVDNGIASPISVRTRSAATSDGLATASWSDPITDSGSAIESSANRWLEIEITLSTDDTTITPELDSVSIGYEAIASGCGRALWSLFLPWEDGVRVDTVIFDDAVQLASGGTGTYETSGTAISGAIQVADWVAWRSLTWDVTLLTGTTISLYYRTSATEGGLTGAAWNGPYVEGVGGVDLSAALEWLQIKLEFATTDTSKTPIFDLLTLNYSEI